METSFWQRLQKQMSAGQETFQGEFLSLSATAALPRCRPPDAAPL